MRGLDGPNPLFLTTGIAAWRCGFPFNMIPWLTDTFQLSLSDINDEINE